MRALILAAGRGSRLGGDEIPKPAWLVGPKTRTDATPVSFIERQVSCLKLAGIKDIGVVVGWQRDVIMKKLDSFDVSIILNTHPEITASGTAHSVHFACLSHFNALNGQEPVLILDGDLLYEMRVLLSVVSSSPVTSIMVTPCAKGDDEEVRVYGDSQRPRMIGKALQHSNFPQLKLFGEALGIMRIEPEDHGFMKQLLFRHFEDECDLPDEHKSRFSVEHEIIAQEMMDSARLQSHRIDESLLFTEVDFPSELEYARNHIYPMILIRDEAIL